ncbi:hypothetical protein ARSEF1564_010014, partial [Beauveria bassiana]
LYYPYRPPTSSSSSSRPTSSNYGSSSSSNGLWDSDRYRGYHNDPYDDEHLVYVPVAAPYNYPQQLFHSGAGMPDVGKQPAMTQAPVMQQQQQQQQPVRPT